LIGDLLLMIIGVGDDDDDGFSSCCSCSCCCLMLMLLLLSGAAPASLSWEIGRMVSRSSMVVGSGLRVGGGMYPEGCLSSLGL